MAQKKEPAITYTEAFEKYFGKVITINSKPFPLKCNCGNYDLYSLNQDWPHHLREKHNERISNRKRVIQNG